MEQNRKDYLKNYSKKYREKNHEKLLELKRIFREKNKERIRAYNKIYEKYHSRNFVAVSQWRDKNKDLMNAKRALRRIGLTKDEINNNQILLECIIITKKIRNHAKR